MPIILGTVAVKFSLELLYFGPQQRLPQHTRLQAQLLHAVPQLTASSLCHDL
jgi:hypothetical protein